MSSCNQIKTTVNSKLVEGEDYVDHSTTFDGKNLSYDKSMWYVNQLKDVPLADPFVFSENDTYYIVGTSDRDNSVVDMYVTSDFVNYELKKGVFAPKQQLVGWENKTSPKVYAPEIYKIDGVYYMYYSALDETNIRRNSVVFSDKIDGPYQQIINSEVNGTLKPLFEDNNASFNVLDATIFSDDDGQRYMYYTVTGNESHYIVGVKLINPYKADFSTYKILVEPGALNSSNRVYKPLSWELFRSTIPITEGPFMIKSNGKYYLTYSVNGCWNKYYNVCYAVSDSPLGNFVKPYISGQIWTNLLLGYPGTKNEDSLVYQQWSGFASGTGHHCFFKCGEQLMIGYHAHQNRNWNNEFKWTARYFAFDYVHFDEEGKPFVNGPTNSIQILPESISSYRNIASSSKVKVKNITNEKAINDNYIVESYNLAQEEGKEVVLGKGYSLIELTFDKEYEIGGFAINNSAYFEKAIGGIEYVDFGDGNAVKNPLFSADKYVKEDLEFVYPNSAITVQLNKTFKAKKVSICFNQPDGGQINEVAIFGK